MDDRPRYDLIDSPNWPGDDEEDDLGPGRGVIIAVVVTVLLWLGAIWALFGTGVIEW